MSGVRVRDQELLRLGMTLPGFVERSRVIASLPSLGLLIVTTFLSVWGVIPMLIAYGVLIARARKRVAA